LASSTAAYINPEIELVIEEGIVAVGVIVDTGNRIPCAHFLSNRARHEIDLILTRHGQKVVALTDLGSGQNLSRTSVSAYNPHILFLLNSSGTNWVCLHHGYIVSASAQLFRHMSADFTGTNDNNFHDSRRLGLMGA
jgi:hypothetical protein